MKVGEAMKFFSAYHGVAPRFDLLERLGLGDQLHSQFKSLSTGLQRRLALALAVTHNPPIVILDEPTAGLDVGSRSALHNLMEELREGGTAILLATHDMAEAEKMSDQVAIMLRGKIVTTGTPREITATGSGFTKISVRTEASVLQKNGMVFPGVCQHSNQEDYAIYYSTDPGSTVSALIAAVDAQQDRLIDLRVERPTLEERFLEITHTGELK
jgi:ABC-2 type transport system ATP-binding protein